MELRHDKDGCAKSVWLSHSASVDEVDQVKEQGRKFFENSLNKAEESARRAGVSLKTEILYGHRSEAILDHAKKK